MAGNGYYSMHRGWQENPIFRGEEFSRRDAFVWLIEEAAFADRRIGTGSGTIELKRGQLSHSIRYMATAWKWEQTRVRRFLRAASDMNMIRTETATGNATGQTVVTICNYDKYQTPSDQPATANAERAPQQRHSNATKKNKGIREEEDLDKSKSIAPRAKRLPEGWRPATLNRETVAGEIAERRGQEWMRRTFETFDNHWRGATGKGATKLDWQGTWANWVINQDGRDRPNGAGHHNGQQSRSGHGVTIDATLDFIAGR